MPRFRAGLLSGTSILSYCLKVLYFPKLLGEAVTHGDPFFEGKLSKLFRESHFYITKFATMRKQLAFKC